MKTSYLYLLLLSASFIFLSCKKDDDDITPLPADPKPKLGTTWTYRYYWWNSPGGATNSKILTYRAKAEVTLGGDKWLHIVDVENDTTVNYLNTRVDGLYQYTNNSAYILCKTPATLNETYTSYNEGGAETFIVRGVNDSVQYAIGRIPVMGYDGVKGTDVIHNYSYNKNAWIVGKNTYYRLPAPPGPGVYYLIRQMRIESIAY